MSEISENIDNIDNIDINTSFFKLSDFLKEFKKAIDEFKVKVEDECDALEENSPHILQKPSLETFISKLDQLWTDLLKIHYKMTLLIPEITCHFNRLKTLTVERNYARNLNASYVSFSDRNLKIMDVNNRFKTELENYSTKSKQYNNFIESIMGLIKHIRKDPILVVDTNLQNLITTWNEMKENFREFMKSIFATQYYIHLYEAHNNFITSLKKLILIKLAELKDSHQESENDYLTTTEEVQLEIFIKLEKRLSERSAGSSSIRSEQIERNIEGDTQRTIEDEIFSQINLQEQKIELEEEISDLRIDKISLREGFEQLELEKNSEINKLEIRRNKLEKRMQTLRNKNSDLKTVKNENAKLTDEINELEKQIDEGKNSLENVKKDIKNKEESISRVNDQLKKLQEDRSSMIDKINKINEQKLTEMEAKYQQKIREVKAELEKQQKQYETSSKELENKTERLIKESEQIGKKNDIMTDLKNDFEERLKLKNYITELEKTIRMLTSRNVPSTSREKPRVFESKDIKLVDEGQLASTRRTRLENRLDQLDNEELTLENKLRDSSIEWNSIEKDIENLIQKLNNLEKDFIKANDAAKKVKMLRVPNERKYAQLLKNRETVQNNIYESLEEYKTYSSGIKKILSEINNSIKKDMTLQEDRAKIHLQLIEFYKDNIQKEEGEYEKNVSILTNKINEAQTEVNEKRKNYIIKQLQRRLEYMKTLLEKNKDTTKKKYEGINNKRQEYKDKFSKRTDDRTKLLSSMHAQIMSNAYRKVFNKLSIESEKLSTH